MNNKFSVFNVSYNNLPFKWIISLHWNEFNYEKEESEIIILGYCNAVNAHRSNFPCFFLSC